MPVTDEDFGLLQLSIESLQQHIAELGLNLIIERDFSKLCAYLRAVGSFVNPTYDPDCCRIGGDDFWFRLVDKDGATEACMAERILETADFADLIESGELWWDGGLKAHNGQDHFDIVRPSTTVSGRVSHTGSLWINPRWRQIRLSLHLLRFSRSLCLRNFEIDYNTCFIRRRPKGARALYGYPHVEVCYRGYFPPARGQEELYFCYISQRESIDALRAMPINGRYAVGLVA
jgi:hypothetical protein